MITSSNAETRLHTTCGSDGHVANGLRVICVGSALIPLRRRLRTIRGVAAAPTVSLRTASRVLCLAGCALLAGCAPPEPESAAGSSAFSTDVPGIEERHLSPDFWLAQTRHGDEIVLSADEIAAFNRRAFDAVDNMVRLDALPEAFDRDELVERIRSISKPSSYERWYANGIKFTDADWARFDAMLNLDGIAERNPLRFGMVVERASMRTYPTGERIYNTETPTDIDRFQENGLFPGDAVAILHASTDGNWLLVQTYNYLAWAPRNAIGVGDLDAILDYRRSERFLVVTGDKVFTTFNPELPATSELQLDMGIRLPLLPSAQAGNALRGQNPYTSHAVLLPVRDAAGRLTFEPALVARGQDVNVGYLPYTRGNVIRQSFKFLGERYGWGHDYNARDCTGFVSEVYKTFGILMPRNSGDQRDSVIGENLRFGESDDREARIAGLGTLDVGDLVYIPGHVMLSLGEVDGEPYVIHDVNGLNYAGPDGELYSGVLNTVAVTPLKPLKSDEGKHYVDLMLSIKDVR